MNSVISTEILIDDSEESVSSIRYLKASDVSEREESGDFVVVLELSTTIWVFRGLLILDMSGGVLLFIGG